LVANIGGALTPIGDPPLFLGYLKGVDFFWTLRHLALPTAAMALPLLGLFYLLDRRAFARETGTPPQMEARDERLGIEGG
ncbi:sodium:proton antiporter, partial [Acinetobacter baumannii]